jgi:hypothetical protein
MSGMKQKETTMETKETLTKEQAIELLNDGDDIHTFLNPNGMLIGADMSRKRVIELIEIAETIEIGGPQCVAMKHGLCVRSEGRMYFIESKAGLNEVQDGN